MKILILCTGNSCRSQMAEGILRAINSELEIFSAGTKPEAVVNPHAITVMKEIGIDISSQQPAHINQFIGNSFDYVITVCDHARESCPVFIGEIKNKLHIGFQDPATARGSEAEILPVYRKIRDEINEAFTKFYHKNHIYGTGKKTS
ncbi:MAG: arsenate reductase ArsC [Bacteroidales bacterium]|nr:arsenate reductase ArsC [Bacteroidota bacterium]MBL6949034.1 arsenate reductase ArsC [Bacteroidales bacterium]